MNWLKKIFSNGKGVIGIMPVRTDAHPIGPRFGDNSRGMTFTLYKADGGHILEFRVIRADYETSESRLYIVPAGENFAEYVAKCVTLESLKR